MNYNSAFWKAWREKSISTIDEAAKTVELMRLVGRKVKRMRFVGLCYDLRDDDIEEYVYNSLCDTADEAERQEKSDFDNIDNDFKLERSAVVDEPLLIEFEDGDRLELWATMFHSFVLSMNCIPWNIDSYINLPNIDANVLFSTLLNATVASVEIAPYDSTLNVLSEIVLWFDNGLGLQFYDYFDYCHINLIGKNDTRSYISFGELKKGMLK